MSLYRMMEFHRLGLPIEDAVLWKSGSPKQKSSSTTVSTPTQSAQYNTLLGQSDSWLNSGGFDKNYGGSEDFNNNAGMNAIQQGALGDLVGQGGNIQSLLNSGGQQALGEALGQYDPSNTGLMDAITAANSTVTRDFNQSVMPAIQAGAVGAGQGGSTRQGIAQGIASQGLADTMGRNASTLAFQDQQAFEGRKSNALNNLSNISRGLLSGSAGQYDAGSLQQGQDQRQIDADINKWAYENNVDLNTLLAYKQLVSGDMGGTNVSNSTSSSSGGGNSGLSMLGSVGGAALGSMWGQPGLGASAGGFLGGLF